MLKRFVQKTSQTTIKDFERIINELELFSSEDADGEISPRRVGTEELARALDELLT